MNSVRVGLLGVAYKANVADTRESPTFQVMKILQEYDTRFEIFDPHVPSLSTVSSLPELLRRSEALILMTDHKEFQSLTGPLLKRAGIMAIIDGKNFLDKEGIRRRGIVYRGIGR